MEKLKFYTDRALKNSKAKRVLIFNFISKLEIKKDKTLKIDIPKALIKSGYKKEDLFLANSLNRKIEVDLPKVVKKLSGIKVRNSVSKSFEDRKDPIITEYEISIKK